MFLILVLESAVTIDAPTEIQASVEVAPTQTPDASLTTMPAATLAPTVVNDFTPDAVQAAAKAVESAGTAGSVSLSQIRTLLSSLLQEMMGTSVNNQGNDI